MNIEQTVSGSERVKFSTKETAQAIRVALKAAFPSVKFSVRTSYASMTSSTDISWTDGPTVGEVELITNQFTSRGFDGMTDSTTYHEQVVDGQRVSYSGWVHTRRNVSAALLNKALDRFQQLRAEYGFDPALLYVVDGNFPHVDGNDRNAATQMAGREFAYGCGSAVEAIAGTMHNNGVRVMVKR